MISKILKRFGYIKINKEKEEEEIKKLKEEEHKEKIEQLNKDFDELMSYNLNSAVRGMNNGQ